MQLLHTTARDECNDIAAGPDIWNSFYSHKRCEFIMINGYSVYLLRGSEENWLCK